MRQYGVILGCKCYLYMRVVKLMDGKTNTVCYFIPLGPFEFANNIELHCDTQQFLVLNITFNFHNAQI